MYTRTRARVDMSGALVLKCLRARSSMAGGASAPMSTSTSVERRCARVCVQHRRRVHGIGGAAAGAIPLSVAIEPGFFFVARLCFVLDAVLSAPPPQTFNPFPPPTPATPRPTVRRRAAPCTPTSLLTASLCAAGADAQHAAPTVLFDRLDQGAPRAAALVRSVDNFLSQGCNNAATMSCVCATNPFCCSVLVCRRNPLDDWRRLTSVCLLCSGTRRAWPASIDSNASALAVKRPVQRRVI